MNPRLQQILRNVERKKLPAEKPQPANDLGDAISQLIAEQVEARVSRLVNQPPMATDFKDVPPPPTTPLPTGGTATIERDELGRATAVIVEGRGTLRVVRDRHGRISRMVPADVADGEPK